MIEKDRGKRKGKVELVMHRFLFTFENLMDPFYIFGKNANYCVIRDAYMDLKWLRWRQLDISVHDFLTRCSLNISW